MSDTVYTISEAAKLAATESHVLRYWEEEMELPINRNTRGHRYYTEYDIRIFLAIKELKKKGFTLKKIKGIIPQLYGRVDELPQQEIPKIKDPDVVTPATIDPAEKPLVEEPLVEPFPATQPLSAPTHEDKDKKVQFGCIMERLVKEVIHEQTRGENRYKTLDQRIRVHQLSRKMIAATQEERKKKRKR